MSLNVVPLAPSTLMIKEEELPPINSMELIRMRWEFLLRILKLRVAEPIPVKTVSNKTESCDSSTSAPREVVI